MTVLLALFIAACSAVALVDYHHRQQAQADADWAELALEQQRLHEWQDRLVRSEAAMWRTRRHLEHLAGNIDDIPDGAA